MLTHVLYGHPFTVPYRPLHPAGAFVLEVPALVLDLWGAAPDPAGRPDGRSYDDVPVSSADRGAAVHGTHPKHGRCGDSGMARRQAALHRQVYHGHVGADPRVLQHR